MKIRNYKYPSKAIMSKEFAGIRAGIFAIVLFLIIRNFPDFASDVYRNFFFKYFRIVWDHTIGLLPFPAIYLVIFGIIASVFIYAGRKDKPRYHAIIYPANILGKAISLFFWMWGFNYACNNLQQIEPVSLNEQQVYSLGEKVVTQINEIDSCASAGMGSDIDHNNISLMVKKYLNDQGFAAHGNVKTVEMGNGLFRRLGISGIYIPYAGQGHCDNSYSMHRKLMIIAHETAHGYGITDEGEADFVAFMTLYGNSDESDETGADAHCRYSALLALLRTIRGELHNMNDSLRIELDKKTSASIRYEIMFQKLDAIKYPEYFPELSGGMNNLYLKSMGVKSGAKSYDEFLGRVYKYLAES